MITRLKINSNSCFAFCSILRNRPKCRYSCMETFLKPHSASVLSNTLAGADFDTKVAMALKAAHVMKTGWCEWCQRWCTIPSVFLHVAATPCTDDSPQGTRAGNEYGVTFLPTFVWVCQRLLLRDRVVCHENVPEFCLRFFRATLGSIYIVISIIIDCFDLGWPKRRERRITLFLLREALMDTVSNFEPFVRSCFRTCELAWLDFFVLTDEDFS